MGIDNATIELDGPEVPIMDGSSRPFVFLIQSAGICEQNHPKKFIKITKDIEVKQNDKWAKIEPFDGFKVAFTIDFDHPSFPKETQTSTIECESSSVGSILKFEREKYLEIFKNYGLYNIQDLKIKIK